MTSKEALQIIWNCYDAEAYETYYDGAKNVHEEELKIIEKDLETSEILKTIFKSIIKNYDDIDQNFTIYLNTELYDKLKELLNDK